MFFSFFIAKKYQVFKSKNNFVNLASKVSMFGIAIGTAALIIVLSVFNGFENLIIGMYNTFDPHLKITHIEGKSFNPDSIKDKIKDNNIFNISSVLEEKVLLKYKDKEHIATIKGVSKNYNNQVSIDSLLIQGNYINDYENSNVCIIGSGVAYHLSILSGSIFETIKVFLPNRNASNLLNPLTAFKTSSLLPTGVFSIQSEIDEARSLRDEAQSLLASYERKQKEAMEQAERILETAKADAALATEQAKLDLKESVSRRMAAAEERISTAQAAAEKEVRDAAIKVAIAAASEVISEQLSATEANKLIDSGISEIESKLH